MNFSLSALIYFAAFSHTVFFAALLAKRVKRGTPGVYLFGVLFIVAYWLWCGALQKSGLHIELPHLYNWLPAAPLILGPTCFLYVDRMGGGPAKPLWVKILHYSPAIAITFVSFPALFMSADDKIRIINMMADMTNHEHSPLAVAMIMFIKIHMAAYLGLSWHKLSKIADYTEKNRADVTAQGINWQKQLCACLIAAEALWVTLFLVYTIFGAIDFQSITQYWTLLLSAIALALAYWGLQSPEACIDGALVPTKEQADPKYGRMALDASTAEQLAQEIRSKLEEDTLFLQSDLTLGRLAEYLSVSRHWVSLVINDRLKCSFYQLVNGYRISHAKQLLDSGAALNFSIERIAAESGFNNRVTFNKAFKEFEGVTPTAYRRQLALAS